MSRTVVTMIVLIAASVAISGCGRRQQMAFPADRAGPARPVGASHPPTSDALQSPSPQAQPQRSDELLQRSDERQPDRFDLPPA